MFKTALFILTMAVTTTAIETQRVLVESLSEKYNYTNTTSKQYNKSDWTPWKYVHTPLDENATAMPTTSPTISLKPSPGPTSEKPTNAPTTSPTVSSAPSRSPSRKPSRAPSDIPSIHPSLSPTTTPFPTLTPSANPSNLPTASPSISPTASPSVSSAPSLSPSIHPSDIPSASPSVSSAPSDTPSTSPTLTSEPTASPTIEDGVLATFNVVLKIGIQTLNKTQVKSFEQGTSAWIEDRDTATGKFKNVITTVVKQTSNSTSGRKLVDEELGLGIKFSVAATYAGTNSSFDLYNELNPSFQSENDLWIRALVKENNIFASLQTVIPELVQNEAAASIGTEAISTTGVSVLAASAVLLGLVASVYSMKSYKTAMFGEELRSPTQSSEDEDNQFERKVLPKPSEMLENDEFRVSDGSMDKEYVENKEQEISEWVNNNNPMSPNTLERGSDRDEDSQMHLMNHMPLSYQNENSQYLSMMQQYQNMQRTHGMDPPSALSEVSFGENSNPFARHQNGNLSLFENQKQTSSQLSQLSDLIRGSMAHGNGRLLDDPTTDGEQTDITDTDDDGESSLNSAHRSNYDSEAPSLVENGAELLLTKSLGGTLGAAAVSSGMYADSVISDTSEFFFMTKKTPSTDQSNNDNVTLGARPVEPEEQEQFRERSSYESASARAGLYDVFAPSGPIGIVVDTTKHGPSVHSLKPTSPMLGLINPGDLIVGLDDMDTRSMTAASLTRLMARKSNQRERKITLLAAEHY